MEIIRIIVNIIEAKKVRNILYFFLKNFSVCNFHVEIQPILKFERIILFMKTRSYVS